MDNRRFHLVGATFACTAINPQTLAECMTRLLATGRGRLTEAAAKEIEFLRNWAEKAKVGDTLEREDFKYSVEVCQIRKPKKTGGLL